MRKLAIVAMAAVLSALFVSHVSATAGYEKQGIAMFYSPGVMERVAAHRHLTKPPNVQGYASTTECSNIGKIAYASINGGLIESYLVADCSEPRDRARHIAQGLVIEVDWPSAVRNNFNTLGHAPAILYTVGGHIDLHPEEGMASGHSDR